MSNSKASAGTAIKAASAAQAAESSQHGTAAIGALIAALDRVSDAIDALPLGDPQRHRLLQLQRAVKAPLDAILTDDADELASLATAGVKSLHALASRHRTRFAVEDCPAPCVPLDPYGHEGRVQALGDSLIGAQQTTLQNVESVVCAIRALNEQDELDGHDFAVMFPWIALSLHEAKISSGQDALLPEHVANRPAASHLPRARGGKQGARWPEHDRLKTWFELWKSDYGNAKLSDGAYQSLIIGGLKELGVDENQRKGLFKGQAMRRHRRAPARKPGHLRSAASG